MRQKWDVFLKLFQTGWTGGVLKHQNVGSGQIFAHRHSVNFGKGGWVYRAMISSIILHVVFTIEIVIKMMTECDYV